MKLIVNIPMKPTREYIMDYRPEELPEVGTPFDSLYYVKDKRVEGDTCVLDLARIW